ncbi:PREDICTED: tRNA-dihydrouridine(20a/20b) synthase [NAD(P)+]-like isoform X3 [Priapulus caudatus]|uniref:tRNA-dihydrouridine(20a/20b) synthase [NAD(P)+]-like isoform X3 n=1 Tax=Priapulus caudatus TaxID=37621 RepID=A0ABM1DV98_PRICU|nr:PREDICTED: tRNA-dihydrouridine(20a/20b) synthase [NAD(P)+]-like isoform X3 [Priapulus caudatus]
MISDNAQSDYVNGNFTWKKPLELFEGKDAVKICAPMVRYSKLAFRTLVRKYGVDLAFTPMIISDSFVRSIKARDSDFTTNSGDRPLIVQFAAHNAKDLADATEIVAPYADGVDVNCGCPQKQTVDLCRKAEHAGVSFITIHGRTPAQRREPPDFEAIRIVKSSLRIPVVANGDVHTLEAAAAVEEQTGADGLMSARGLLQNPAMFAGYSLTPLCCVKDWVDISLSQGVPSGCFQHHLSYMLEKVLPRPQVRVLNCLQSTSAIIDHLRELHIL